MPDTDTFLTAATRQRLHAMLDMALAVPGSRGVIFMAAAVCQDDMAIGAVACGTLSGRDVLNAFSGGGRKLLGGMREQTEEKMQ